MVRWWYGWCAHTLSTTNLEVQIPVLTLFMLATKGNQFIHRVTWATCGRLIGVGFELG